MNDKNNKIIIYFLLAIIVCLGVYKLSSSTKLPTQVFKGSVNSDDYDVLENSIIIDGLQMNSDVPLKDNVEFETETTDGEIFFVENFEKENQTPKEKNNNKIILKNKKNHSKKTAKTTKKTNKKFISKNNKNTILAKLQKKDSKWHYTNYKIKKGEHLWGIAKKFKISHKLIIKVNNILKPDMLRAGKTILVPNKTGIFYKIKRNDNLTLIAKKYKTTIEKIAKHNNLNKNKIIIGKKIFLPDVIKDKPKNKRNKKYLTKKNTNKKSNSKKSIKKIAFKWPLKGKITSAFGKRIDPFSKKKKFHCGIDISAIVGSRVSSSAPGKVIYSGWKKGYGKIIVIQHKYGFISVYAHLNKLLKKVNDIVKEDEIIALSGQTGNVTGAHLHFEIRKHLTPLNPMRLIKHDKIY